MAIKVFVLAFVLLQISSTALELSTDFIRRDSPSSSNAIHRSVSRLSHLKSLYSNIDSELWSASGDYFMEVYIGEPPLKQLLIADTGSDLTWTQCSPCSSCFKQELPIMDPKKSASYKLLPCNSCLFQACGNEGSCPYQRDYADHSFSKGVLGLDMFTLGGTSIPRLIFGCGRNNHFTSEQQASGIIGLGGGNYSFVGQLRESIGDKFSYCLSSNVTSGSRSRINFGSIAEVSGSGVVTTPMNMIKMGGEDTFYFITLEAISVGESLLESVNVVKQGNIIIDSGSTYTHFPRDIYQAMEDAIKTTVKAEPVDGSLDIFKLCYIDNNITIPPIIAHFAGGANVTLLPTNTFLRVDDKLCLAIFPADHIYIFGNLAQSDHLIGYDLERQQISFKATNCTVHSSNSKPRGNGSSSISNNDESQEELDATLLVRHYLDINQSPLQATQ
ncbi:aspartic proteinase CDR1-like [Impatiens glandulifera]|uniref:aspartic proteinase CDR1-like n=1 Tax=Impatiens glandulifera TaxID=253017 RepID=UPI001FB180AA|nr:aspartic proteinase CDR1-like [Impatiens glandulifera]